MKDGKAVPTFPRARYYIQKGEWDHALHPTERDRASYVPQFLQPAEGQTEFLHGNKEIMPGIRVEMMPGHTRHMQCVWIESEGESACFVGDLVPTCAHLPYPWIMSFDLFPMETLENKHRLLPRLAEKNSLVIFPHEARTPCVRLREEGGKIVAVPID